MSYRLAILDFDGTLADTRELVVRTNQEAMRRLGYPIIDAETITGGIGLPLRKAIFRLYPDFPIESLPVWERTYREVFEEMKGDIVPGLFPNVRETLEVLSGKGVRFTVASARGSKSLNDFLRNMGIAPFIPYVLGVDDVTNTKPDPEPVLKTMQDLSCDPSETLVVGDMPVDIQMGLGAGARTCGVTYGNSNREALTEAGAHYVIDDFGELGPILLQP